MLSDRHSRLLCAYVDGELGRRHRKVAVRLLRRSVEARSLLRQLRKNARLIAGLPPQQLPSEFSTEVLRAIGDLRPAASSAHAPRLAGARSFPTWLGSAAAAAVLLTVTAASYYFFVNLLPRDIAPAMPVAQQKPRPKATSDALVAQVLQGTVQRFGEPGIVVAVQDLDQEKTEKRLARDLKKENAVHLDLVCKNSAQTVDGLSHVFADNGIKLLVDPGVKAKLKVNEPAQTEFLVFAENLSPEELAAILRQLGVQEKQKSAADRQFETVRLESMTSQERQKLSKILGVDAKKLQPAPLVDLGTFIEAPGTKNGKGKSGKPELKQERFAMVMASNGPASPAEVQRFLRNRSAPRPGTLQIVLVVRPA